MCLILPHHFPHWALCIFPLTVQEVTVHMYPVKDTYIHICTCMYIHTHHNNNKVSFSGGGWGRVSSWLSLFLFFFMQKRRLVFLYP